MLPASYDSGGKHFHIFNLQFHRHLKNSFKVIGLHLIIKAENSNNDLASHQTEERTGKQRGHSRRHRQITKRRSRDFQSSERLCGCHALGRGISQSVKRQMIQLNGGTTSLIK